MEGKNLVKPQQNVHFFEAQERQTVLCCYAIKNNHNDDDDNTRIFFHDFLIFFFMMIIFETTWCEYLHYTYTHYLSFVISLHFFSFPFLFFSPPYRKR